MEKYIQTTRTHERGDYIQIRIFIDPAYFDQKEGVTAERPLVIAVESLDCGRPSPYLPECPYCGMRVWSGPGNYWPCCGAKATEREK